MADIVDQKNSDKEFERFCPECLAIVDAHDRYCRRCGRHLSKSVPWFYHPIWIIVLTLTILGPLTLPLVFKSPKLDRNGKIAMTTFVLLFTFFLGYAFFIIPRVVFNQLEEFRYLAF